MGLLLIVLLILLLFGGIGTWPSFGYHQYGYGPSWPPFSSSWCLFSSWFCSDAGGSMGCAEIVRRQTRDRSLSSHGSDGGIGRHLGWG